MTLAGGDAPIDTPPLTLRRLRPEDLAFVVRIHSDPRVRRYLGGGLPLAAEESRAYLDNVLASYQRTGPGQLAMVRKSGGETIISIIDAENAASLRVARKFGLEREDTISMSGRSFDRYRWP
jgi:RimJ/RimL family protein N-acetyltransferase